MPKGVKIDETTFCAAKKALANGKRQSEVCEFFGVSDSVVCLINTSDSYETYCNRNAQALARRKQQKESQLATKSSDKTENAAPPKATIQMLASHYMDQTLRAQADSLEIIVKRLGYLLDALDAWPPEKKEAINNA